MTMTPNEQFQALNLLDYLIDLFTASPRQNFSRAAVLSVLDATKNDPDFFDPSIRELQIAATSNLAPAMPNPTRPS